MSDQKGSSYKAAQLAQFLKDEDDFEKAPANWWAAVVEDREALNLLTQYESTLDEPVDETAVGKEIIRKQANKAVFDAVQNQNLAKMSSQRGFPYANNVGGTRELLDLVGRIEKGYISYIYGQMGTGKTDFAILLAELWNWKESGEIGTNISSLEQKDRLIERFDTLDDWVSDSGDRLFIFDEASSYASGYGSDAGNVTKHFRSLLRTFRKNQANLLIIGHTGKDVHPDVRRLSTDIIHKESKKKATIYDDVDEGEGEGEKAQLEGIDPTSWNFDTYEESRWFWES